MMSVSTKGAELAPKSPLLARAVKKAVSKETDETWYKFFPQLGDSLWKLESRLRFLACDFLDGPRQQRAFWADSAPFVDTGRLIVICGNYWGTKLYSSEKAKIWPNLDTILAFSPDLTSTEGLKKPFVGEGRLGHEQG